MGPKKNASVPSELVMSLAKKKDAYVCQAHIMFVSFALDVVMAAVMVANSGKQVVTLKMDWKLQQRRKNRTEAKQKSYLIHPSHEEPFRKTSSNKLIDRLLVNDTNIRRTNKRMSMNGTNGE